MWAKILHLPDSELTGEALKISSTVDKEFPVMPSVKDQVNPQHICIIKKTSQLNL